MDNATGEGEVTVRIPFALLTCKVTAIVAVAMMIMGTMDGRPEVRAWALLIAILSAGLGIGAAVRAGTEAMKAYVHRWTLETFEHGVKQGIDMGREIEAAERFIASARK